MYYMLKVWKPKSVKPVSCVDTYVCVCVCFEINYIYTNMHMHTRITLEEHSGNQAKGKKIIFPSNWSTTKPIRLGRKARKKTHLWNHVPHTKLILIQWLMRKLYLALLMRVLMRIIPRHEYCFSNHDIKFHHFHC